MYKTDAIGKRNYITPWSKEEVDSLLKKYNITLNNKIGYDYVFAANMCKADYMGSSIMDEQHVALFIKDYVDDKDGYLDKILQESPEVKSSFETDIPIPKKSKAKGATNPYGN